MHQTRNILYMVILPKLIRFHETGHFMLNCIGSLLLETIVRNQYATTDVLYKKDPCLFRLFFMKRKELTRKVNIYHKNKIINFFI